MGYKLSFLDNETYGAEDVSRTFSHLVSGGVIAYPENRTVAEALDEMTSQVTSAGVSSFGGLEVTKTETGVRIGEGAGFFESGVSFEVDSDGVEMEATFEVDKYVYFLYEKDLNYAAPYVSGYYPTGDAVMLATVLTDGRIVDMRSFARSKILPSTANHYLDFNVTMRRFNYPSVVNEYNTAYYEMPHNGYRYLILKELVGTTRILPPVEHVLDLSIEGEQKLRIDHYKSSESFVHVEKTGTTLKIWSSNETSNLNVHTYYFMLV